MWKYIEEYNENRRLEEGRIDDTKAATEDAHIRERMYLESLQ